jgi:hypothetical protein
LRITRGARRERNNAKRCESRAAPNAPQAQQCEALRIARRAAPNAPQAQQCEALRNDREN